MALAKKYDPHATEKKWYRYWLDGGFFHAEVDKTKEPFCIVIPPPNVTGQLHLGHALDNTLQDILIRWQRMKGKNAVWIPGTDHAGIATQIKVEEELAKEGKTRHDLGREKFLSGSGSGKNATAAESSSSSRIWAPPAIGSGRGSPWTKAAPEPCGKSL